MALNNCGHRVIGRLLQIHQSYIGRWLNEYTLKCPKKHRSNPQKTPIQVLELDELWTYCKKKKIKSGYGLLWTEIGLKWLILK